jgi:hypothetical protein
MQQRQRQRQRQQAVAVAVDLVWVLAFALDREVVYMAIATDMAIT